MRGRRGLSRDGNTRDRPEVQVNLALYWNERGAAGDVERAEKQLRALLARTPEQPFVLFNLGAILEQNGKSTEAAAAYRRTLQLDPKFSPARDRLRALAPDGS
jgi:Flp pilus assembly protein TadD